jgi:hypothetical protein
MLYHSLREDISQVALFTNSAEKKQKKTEALASVSILKSDV